MPVAMLTDLFTAVGGATIAAQLRLDEGLPYRPRWVYSLPRVQVDARFGVTQVEGRTFWWFGTSSRQDRQNTLHFRLLASDVAAEAAPAAAAPQIGVSCPAFLVPLAERVGLVADLIKELRTDSPRYQNEIDAIQEAFTDGKDDPGITFFRLTPQTLLIVRLGGFNDGIFLRDETANPRHVVFSYMGMGEALLAWAPFHELFEILRNWQTAGCPQTPVDGTTVPARFGSIEVTAFASDLTLAVSDARGRLAGSATTSPYPVRYSLHDVSADLAYSVARSTGAAEVAASPLIRSVASVRVDPVTVGLLSPEYILTGATRSAFFELFDDFLSRSANDASGLWRHLSPEYRHSYERALKDPQRRRTALVLLSYRGKTPLNQFLVIWTGAILDIGQQGEEREFAFRVRLDNKRLTFSGITLPLEDPTRPDAIFGSPQRPFQLARVHYDADHPGLHDFFHAAWIWDLAGEWFLR